MSREDFFRVTISAVAGSDTRINALGVRTLQNFAESNGLAVVRLGTTHQLQITCVDPEFLDREAVSLFCTHAFGGDDLVISEVLPCAPE